MKRFLPILMILLAGCGSKTVTFTATFDTGDAVRRTELTAAMGRMIDGRLTARGKKLLKLATVPGSDTMTITVHVSDAEAAKLLTESLTQTFTMEIMKQVEAGQGDIVSEKFGEFQETGIVTKHFDWVTAGTMQGPAGQTLGSALVQFTKEGQELLKRVFAQNRGKVIGIFVRGQLMSKKLIDKTDKQDSIAIDGIPNAELAASFTDDVNVGLHVMFTPGP